MGGLDERLYEGPILYTPIRREWYYEVIILDMGVSGTSLGLDCKEVRARLFDHFVRVPTAQEKTQGNFAKIQGTLFCRKPST